MEQLRRVVVASLPYGRFRPVLGEERFAAFQRVAARARELLAGRVVWNVSSTGRGGGVAEMLRSLLAYARGAGVDARWLVISGDERFFRVTKRIHNLLHGDPGDGGPLGERERAIYRAALEPNARALSELVRAGDVVILHDPQTAGLVPAMVDRRATVVWRCHIGIDQPNDQARAAWSFLRPFITPAHAYIFSRLDYTWEGLANERLVVVPPSIDAFSPKNQELDDPTVDAILCAAGIVAGGGGQAVFEREDGSPGRVDSRAQMTEEAPLQTEQPFVLQVSRWDRLKDPLGVIEGFARHTAPLTTAHLVVAGPETEAVADDPEGAEVLAEARATWRRLEPDVRARVHLAALPMRDGEENAAIVNALQRRAAVVVQKSVAEGFGLTVAEAMWKGRPVVASRIGGIQDQIDDGVSGLLVDPTDLAAYGQAVAALLGDPQRAARMGAAARARVKDHFLGPRHLTQYVELLERLLATHQA